MKETKGISHDFRALKFDSSRSSVRGFCSGFDCSSAELWIHPPDMWFSLSYARYIAPLAMEERRGDVVVTKVLSNL